MIDSRVCLERKEKKNLTNENQVIYIPLFNHKRTLKDV